MPRAFGRTVIVVLGGVSWGDWAGLSAGNSTLTPGFKQILEEGAVAAARLPGATPNSLSENAPALDNSVAQAAAQAVPNQVSPALLRAAAVLSSGSASGLSQAVPVVTALTLGPQEHLNPTTPSYEEATADTAYSRRTDLAVPPDALVNLGWGALEAPAGLPEEMATFHYGALGNAVHQAGGHTAALGSADTSYMRGRGSLLREWALAAADAHGTVDHGDVSRELLARDNTAPFGVRVNARALLAAFDTALQDDKTALITLEWGDTRRAALYAPWCAPLVASRHRRDALLRADAWLRVVLTRLTDPRRDRLIILAVPDLNTAEAQWLPLVLWRPQRGGQGAFLQMSRNGEGPGVVSVENIFTTLLERLNVPGGASSSGLVEVGHPTSASKRLARLLALQSGVAWLDAARPVTHGLWAFCFALAMLLSLGLLLRQMNRANGHTRGTSEVASGVQNGPGSGSLSPGQQWTQACWFWAMMTPLLAWLVGPCLEVTWRFGHLPNPVEPSGRSSGDLDLKLSLALLAVALLILLVLSTAHNIFRRVRLRPVGIGLVWLFLTILGLAIGGFGLPWNALLGSSLLENPTVRLGDMWSLLLISATLFGVAGLTRPPSSLDSSATSQRPSRVRLSPSGTSVVAPLPLSDEAEAAPEPRRVINLRPAALWMIAVILLLWVGGWGGRNPAAAGVAAVGFGAMWLRLWLESAARAHRLRVRRAAVMIAAAFLVLLLWQRGGEPLITSTLTNWWPGWIATWHMVWWDIAAAATTLAGLTLLLWARPLLRPYLATRYSFRAMLLGTSLAAFAALLIFGSYGLPLIALYTLGAVIYESLSVDKVQILNQQ